VRSATNFPSACNRRAACSQAEPGNGGQGVWKVEQIATPDTGDAIVRVLHARRASVPEEMPLRDFMARCETYFVPGVASLISRFRYGSLMA